MTSADALALAGPEVTSERISMTLDAPTICP
jgi:hypothetical protein